MNIGPGAPVDMDAVDRMGAETAARSEQGVQLAEDGLRKFAGALEGRSGSFTQGAVEGRGYQAIEGGLGTALEAAA